MEKLQVLENIAQKQNTPPLILENFLYHPTGSFYTCTPPVTNTDEDWICWSSDWESVEQSLLTAGFSLSKDQKHYPDCVSYRKDKINIILIFERSLYFQWKRATEVCKYLNLLKKEDRKIVHRIACGEDINLPNLAE